MVGLGSRLWQLLYQRGKLFGVQLKTTRATANWTQQQLADASGLTVTAVAMLERGEREPHLATVLQLCRALDGEGKR